MQLVPVSFIRQYALATPVLAASLLFGAFNPTAVAQPAPRKARAPLPPEAPTQPAPRAAVAKPFEDDALKSLLTERVLPLDTITAQVKTRGVAFRLTPEQEEEFYRAGASDELLDTMRASYRGPDCPVVTAGAAVSSQSLVTMLESGVASVCVEQTVRARGVNFAATNEVIRDIQSAGASLSLLAAIRTQAQKRAETTFAQQRAETTFAQQRAETTYMVADGTKLRLQLTSAIDTRVNNPGDKFSAVVLFPAEYSNAEVMGHVADIKRSGNMTGRTEIALAFDSIKLRDGRSGILRGQVEKIVMSDSVQTVDAEGNVKSASQTKKTAGRTAGGAMLGAAIGAIAGGGKGAAVGAIIGGSVGAGSMDFTGAANIVLQPGTEIAVVAAAPTPAR